MTYEIWNNDLGLCIAVVGNFDHALAIAREYRFEGEIEITEINGDQITIYNIDGNAISMS